ncbi:MAG: flagellar hook-basal body complex protein FliE [Caulobacteraceae bacterium]|nr:flagellar hook-basal body complex protein FliE [Caulobacteraceae bacterium]
MTTAPIQAITAALAPDAAQGAQFTPSARATPGASFAQTLLSGVDQVNDKLVQADALAKAFAVDDSIPVHQVTFALEQARLSFELMLQVRSRLVESYQEFSRMQL